MPFLETFRTLIKRGKEKSSHHDSMPVPLSRDDGIFANAHNFTIAPATFVDYSVRGSPGAVTMIDQSQLIYSGTTVIDQILDRGDSAATHDSSNRAYPPKCHPDTRKSLRGTISRWVDDPERRNRILWIMGPAAVGKSAVAQTIAEESERKGRLGATFFFSRPNHHSNPDTLIPTLAYQLAVKVPRYRYIITGRLGDDTTILRKNRRVQFRELITEPLGLLVRECHPIVSSPLLIIIDGLDECASQEAQCEFIEMISGIADHLPLLWMVCSRPEFHLKSIKSDPDFHVSCIHEDILVDDDEAQRDVQRLLRVELEKIRRQYAYQLSDDWPAQEHVRQIALVASGHLGFAAFVLRFIGDKDYGDPAEQLDVCLRFISGKGLAPGATNPLHALDLLYRQILSDVPESVIGVTMRILSLLILNTKSNLSAQAHANFFSLDQNSFYRSLQKLHSVLHIPPPDEAHEAGLHVYHASFTDYLSDPTRSGVYAIVGDVAIHDIAIHSLKWCSPPEDTFRVSHSGQRVEIDALLELSWPGKPRDVLEGLVTSLRHFCAEIRWNTCLKVSTKFLPELVSALKHFPFSRAKDVVEGDFAFFLFLDRISSLEDHQLCMPLQAEQLPTRLKKLDYISIPSIRTTRSITIRCACEGGATVKTEEVIKTWKYKLTSMDSAAPTTFIIDVYSWLESQVSH